LDSVRRPGGEKQAMEAEQAKPRQAEQSNNKHNPSIPSKSTGACRGDNLSICQYCNCRSKRPKLTNIHLNIYMYINIQRIMNISMHDIIFIRIRISILIMHMMTYHCNPYGLYIYIYRYMYTYVDICVVCNFIDFYA
jgi:hypothetical protein